MCISAGGQGPQPSILNPKPGTKRGIPKRVQGTGALRTIAKTSNAKTSNPKSLTRYKEGYPKVGAGHRGFADDGGNSEGEQSADEDIHDMQRHVQVRK